MHMDMQAPAVEECLVWHRPMPSTGDSPHPRQICYEDNQFWMAHLEQILHHLSTHTGCDGCAVLQAGAAVHLYQPHIQVFIHHKVIAKQLMTVGP